MDNFINPIVGGMLIGLSAVILMMLLGRVAGISGIFYSALKPDSLSRFFSKDQQWRWVFVVGLPLGVILARYFLDHSAPELLNSNIFLVGISGLLVGFGTKLGSGCTSGHGVCGISRFSLRSVLATLIFITSGVMAVLATNLIMGAL